MPGTPEFSRIEVKVLHHTNEWGVPVEARSLAKGESMLIVVSDTGVTTYTLSSADEAIATLVKTQRVTKEI